MFSLFFWRRKPSAALKPIVPPPTSNTTAPAPSTNAQAPAYPPSLHETAAPHPSLARVAEAIRDLPPAVTSNAPAPAAAPPMPRSFFSSQNTTPLPKVQPEQIKPAAPAQHLPPPPLPQNLSFDASLENAIERDLASRRPASPPQLIVPDLDERASNAFYAANGNAFWTVRELGDALLSMDEGTFNCHVTNEKNDFAAWIQGCFSERTRVLAQAIQGKSREQIIKQIVVSTAPVFSTAAKRPETLEHHEDKRSAPYPWVPPRKDSQNSSERVKSTLDALQAAKLQATTDIGQARELFIAARTKVWQELSDEERTQVLPTLRETYEFLRTYA